MNKIKISAITYLNTKPFLYGITHSDLLDSIDLSLDVPSVCADKLKDGTVDIGIIPVAEIAHIPGANIVTDFCISCSGKVRTVVLVSQVPIDQIKRIVLDYQSRTSVQLVRILARDYWKIQPEWQQGSLNYIKEDIKGATAGVIIGIVCLNMKVNFPMYTTLGGLESPYRPGFRLCLLGGQQTDSGKFRESIRGSTAGWDCQYSGSNY